MSKPLLWIDLEMTGLDEKTDSILELAAVITTMDLKPLEELHRVVYQPDEVLKNMNDWCKKTHGESGLTAAVPKGTPLAQVEKDVVAMLGRHFATSDRIVLAGNSVGNDRRFIDRYMPELAKRLHYRLVDVSSFKEVFRERYGIHVAKKDAHRAVDDIHESIRELETYLSYVQIPEKTAEKK
jgi:oligoribonuclease